MTASTYPPLAGKQCRSARDVGNCLENFRSFTTTRFGKSPQARIPGDASALAGSRIPGDAAGISLGMRKRRQIRGCAGLTGSATVILAVRGGSGRGRVARLPGNHPRPVLPPHPQLVERISHGTGAVEEFIATARTAMPLLLAAVDAVLRLADRLDRDDRSSADRATARMFREAITRALTGKEAGDA